MGSLKKKNTNNICYMEATTIPGLKSEAHGTKVILFEITRFGFHIPAWNHDLKKFNIIYIILTKKIKIKIM